MDIIFKKNIYKLSAVKKAINEFKHLADFTLMRKGDNINVDIKKIDKTVADVLRDEFCNYVLYLMKI